MRTVWNYDHTKEKVSLPGDQPSKTVPDMTYTPQQLLQRYARGLPMDKLGNHFYSGDHVLPDFRKLDLTEQAEILNNQNEIVKQKREAYDKKEAERKQQRAEWLANANAYNQAIAEAAKLKKADASAQKTQSVSNA